MGIEWVYCPLLKKNIDNNGECFDIVTVCEGLAPKWTAPKEIYDVKNYAEICLNCEHNKNKDLK